MTSLHVEPSFAASAPANYQRFFVPVIGQPLAEDLLRKAALRAGERVLDVGCGTGVVARLAAEQIGPQGKVAGLDVNPGMLAVAKSATLPPYDIEWLEASAEKMPCADSSFDVVLCQLSLQFIPDRSAALKEMYRVLVPGGRLILSVPGPAAPIFETLAAALEQHVAPQAANFVHTVFALHKEAQIEELLGSARFRNIETYPYTRELPLPAARDFLWQYIESTPLAGAVGGVSAQARSDMERDVLTEWAQHEAAGALMYSQRVVMASAQR